ncbi:MAG: hypothetical protein Q9222_002789 [Ikaeria aurantiellina]
MQILIQPLANGLVGITFYHQVPTLKQIFRGGYTPRQYFTGGGSWALPPPPTGFGLWGWINGIRLLRDITLGLGDVTGAGFVARGTPRQTQRGKDVFELADQRLCAEEDTGGAKWSEPTPRQRDVQRDTNESGIWRGGGVLWTINGNE